MAVPLTFLLVGAGFFLLMAAVGIIRGTKLKEKAYCVTGLVCILLSVWLLLMYFNQILFGICFFFAGVLIAFFNYRKSMDATYREATAYASKTDLSKPLKLIEVFSWVGWFKIATHWGTRKATVFYALFNLAFIMIFLALLVLLNVGGISFIAVVSAVAVPGVLVSSIAIFNQQVIRNIKQPQNNH